MDPPVEEKEEGEMIFLEIKVYLNLSTKLNNIWIGDLKWLNKFKPVNFVNFGTFPFPLATDINGTVVEKKTHICLLQIEIFYGN